MTRNCSLKIIHSSDANDNKVNSDIFFFVDKVNIDCASFMYLCRVSQKMLLLIAASWVLYYYALIIISGFIMP